MTPDELRAALLLLGFRTNAGTRDPTMTLVKRSLGKRVLVRFNTNPNKVGISYRKAGHAKDWNDFNTDPESAFNFIKKRFYDPG